MLIIGESGGDFGARCKVLALDAKTGQDQVAVQRDPGRQGVRRQHMAEEARVPRRRRRLGTADRRSGARPRLHRRRQPGPVQRQRPRGKGKELFTESVVALNINTGKYRWHYQEVHHDIWDYDTAANPLVALRPEIKGQDAEGDR